MSFPSPVRAVAASLALCATLAGAPALAQQAEELTSPGGIAFSHLRMPDQESVSIQVAWPSDWPYIGEPAGTPYVAAELLPAGGAGDLTPAEVQQAFEELQAEGGLSMTADHAYGYLNARARDLDAAIELGASVLSEPALDEDWLARIRDGLATNMAEAVMADGSRAGDVLRRLSLGASGLVRFLSLSPPEVITDVTRADVQRWQERTLVRTGMTVAVAGGIDAEAAGEAVDALLGGLPIGEGEVETPDVDVDETPMSIVLQDPESDKSTMLLVGRLPPTSQGGELEDILISMTLGGGDESRLFETLRTTLRASYAAEALIDNQSRLLRILVLYAEAETDKLPEARTALRDAYDAFVTDGPTDEELAAAKANLAEGVRQMLESPVGAAGSLVQTALDGQPATRVSGLPDELEAVTMKSVRARLAAVYPSANQLQEVIVTPEAEGIDGACIIASVAELDSCERP